MVRARKPLIAFGVATLVLAACGSDDDKSSSSSSSSTLPGSTTVTSSLTATTLPGAATSVTLSPVTVASVATTVPGATTTTAAGSTSTTVKGRTNVTSPSDNVRLGDKGDGVKQIQTALKAAGYKVTVDGDFGNQTDAAVRQFQKKNGLKVDGIVGKITWGKLSTAGTSTSSSSGATTTTA